MNEQAKQALSEFVQKMLTAAESSAHWTAEQAPMVVQEWLAWQLWSSAIWFAAAATVVVLALWATAAQKRAGDAIKGSYSSEREALYLGAVVTGAIGTLGGLVALLSIASVVKVLVAPRVVILEKFAELIR